MQVHIFESPKSIYNIHNKTHEFIFNREMLEDAPLVTSALRQLDEEQRALNQLNKYRQAIVRIQFPNQLVLQGIFSSKEKVKELYDFVRNFLQYPEKDFILCTLLIHHKYKVQINFYLILIIHFQTQLHQSTNWIQKRF